MTANCLTLHQPYASLIVAGVKTIETRPRRMKYRGRLYVHAGAKKPTFRDGTRRVGPYFCSPDDTAGGDWVAQSDDPDLWLPLGAVVGHVDVVGCQPIVADVSDRDGEHRLFRFDRDGRPELWRTGRMGPPKQITDQLPFGDFAPGRWAILLENPVRYDEPIPAKGKQGLWTFDDRRDG